MSERAKQTLDWMSQQGFTLQEACSSARAIDNLLSRLCLEASQAADKASWSAKDAAWEATYNRETSVLVRNLDLELQSGPADVVEAGAIIKAGQHAPGWGPDEDPIKNIRIKPCPSVRTF